MKRARIMRYTLLALSVLLIVFSWPNPTTALLMGLLIGLGAAR